jgi:hypothetical protein
MKRTQIPAVLFAMTAAVGLSVRPARSAVIESCPQTSDPNDYSGSVLDTDTTKEGVVYDDASGGHLQLENEGGSFRSTTLGISDLTVFAAVADFDQDGWDDFVGAGEATSFVRVYRNDTEDNLPDRDGNPTNGLQPMNWDDPAAVLSPKFTMAYELNAAATAHRWRPTAAADFDGNGYPDVFRAVADPYYQPTTATLWLNQTSTPGGTISFAAGYGAMATGNIPEYLGVQTWGGTNIISLDYNGDRKIDILVGTGEGGGSVRIFQNNCTLQSPLPDPLPADGLPLPCAAGSPPHFAYAGELVTGLGFGTGKGSLPVFAYKDFDGDDREDLIVGAPICCSDALTRLRVFKGVDGGGIEPTASQSITFVGAATAVLAADFSLDGEVDLIVGTDNWNYPNPGAAAPLGNSIGGASYYYVNNRSGTPFSDGVTRQLTSFDYPALYDFDVGFVFDYDHDPSNTPDIMIADGNHTGSFYVFANRVVNTYVECGDVASGIVDLGDLAETEMVVTAARIDPDLTLNSGTVTFFLSNEDPANWVEATDCGDGSGDLCASFPKPVGRDVRWKATLCANSFQTQTPSLHGLEMTFDYTLATEHYRAGVVVADGVAYVSAFRQPGERGLFYAIDAGLSTTYWEAAAKLDAMDDSDRAIYTSDRDGMTRLDFTAANAGDVTLQLALGATDATQAAAVISWVRSARFGIGNDGIPYSKLGAIETSTPAVLQRPGPPLWYAFAVASDRALADQFMSTHAARIPLVLFGSKDGMIHAVRNHAASISDTTNGNEAWAYVPAKVAGDMIPDYTNSMDGSLDATAYPDGSPTLSDVKIGGSLRTVAVVAGGNGSKSVVALDVTETVDLDTGAVLGPQPLWHGTPGEGDAGQAYAKPAVARVLINNTVERFITIAATGVAFDNIVPPYLKGRVVSAYDVATGELLWQFKTRCPVTSDITTFETDDVEEPGAPSVNGFADRAVFADACGYLYKVDPGKDLDGGWNENAGFGEFDVSDLPGVRQYALFSTKDTLNALDAESPIAGTLAARVDESSRVVLFFGTGGLESHDATQPNEFYAIYADTGVIRSKLAGACAAGTCEKFYGGVVVTPTSVILTRAVDPKVGTGTCDPGSATLEVMSLDADPDGDEDFVSEYVHNVDSSVMGSLYGDANALYFATLSGDVVRVGTPRAESAGDDSASGYMDTVHFGEGGETGGAGLIGTTEPMTLLGWRQAY